MFLESSIRSSKIHTKCRLKRIKPKRAYFPGCWLTKRFANHNLICSEPVKTMKNMKVSHTYSFECI